MIISVIIPVFNEEATIEQTILDFHKYLPEALFFVIDNNSTDQTAAITLKTFKSNNINGRIIFERRQGKGNAIKTAFSVIDSDIYIMIDGDSTYKGMDVYNLLRPVLDNESDMVVGDRHKSGAYQKETKRLFHKFGNNLVRKTINFLFDAHLNDILSGYRIFNKCFVKNFPILTYGFELETEITLHALDKKFRITEVPITYEERPAGSFSKINTIKDGIKIINTIFQIFRYYKPFIFFTFISILLFLTAIFSGLTVIIEFVNTHYITHVPLAILSTGLMIMSLLCFSIGLILDSLGRYQKFNYHLHLLNRNNF
ncbi:MAG: glycosyltransferase family 2 protein [Bacteroidales bacterium]|jgi:glycosyltransferase involved in cell wall biosynthesis|nr:glycosyltransferase family 2 protein [Bacteroidales bacterium]